METFSLGDTIRLELDLRDASRGLHSERHLLRTHLRRGVHDARGERRGARGYSGS